jgi:hypothetical protein
MGAVDDSPFRPTERVLRQFAAISVVFFGAAAWWQEFHHHRHVLAVVIAVLAMTIGPLGLASPRAIRPVFIGWMALAYPVGWTVSRIVLGMVFYGLFTPLGWIFRFAGRDELILRPRPDEVTYWRPKPSVVDKAQYLRQF